MTQTHMDSNWHRTKIICTLGPATDRPDILEQMICAGMSVARINTAHGTPDSHARQIQLVRAAAATCGESVAILVDLPGPKFRVGELKNRWMELRSGNQVVFSAGEADASAIPLSHPELIRELKVGESVYLADGSVQLQVMEISGARAICQVIIGGMIRSGSGINLPESTLATRIPTQEDLRQIQFALDQQADWLGVSFVRTGEDIQRVRSHLPAHAGPKVMAKIEKQQAIADLEKIVELSDGVMVARGDLGVETELAGVPLLQKRIVRLANELARPVIVATQMLESMVDHSHPTRAEVTDVANAVLDGTDAVMLSAETAIGKFPVEAVETLGRVLMATEAEFPYGRTRRRLGAVSTNDTGLADAISYTAYQLSLDLHAKALIVPAHQLSAVVRIARFRPNAPLLVLAESELLYRQLSLVWGVAPVRTPKLSDLASCLTHATEVLCAQQMAIRGDLAIVVRASTPDAPASDTLQVVEL